MFMQFFPAPKPETNPPLWSLPYDVTALKQRLAQLPPDDPLYPLLLGYLDACVVNHADARVTTDQANQFVGRLNALADLRTDLHKLWREAHTPPKK